jgi:hypothetical protein
MELEWNNLGDGDALFGDWPQSPGRHTKKVHRFRTIVLAEMWRPKNRQTGTGAVIRADAFQESASALQKLSANYRLTMRFCLDAANLFDSCTFDFCS